MLSRMCAILPASRLAAATALLAKARSVELPELGVERSVAQAVVDALRGKTIEALDRIVEVVSGNTPHASSAPTRGIVAFFSSCVNAVFGKISTNRSTLLAARAARCTR